MGWIIAAGIVTLLAILPLGVSIRYDAGGAVLRVIAGPVRFTVFPRPKKQKKEKPAKQEQKVAAPAKPEQPEASVQPEQPEKPLPQPPQPPKQEPEPKPKEETGGSLADFLPLVQLGIRFLGDLRRKLRLNNLQLKLTLAGGDPCDLAVNYGRTWAAVSNLIPRLDSWFVIKKRDISVQCDFVAPETLVFAHLDLTITLGRLISLVVVYAIRALKEYLNLKNKRKGGAVT